jgi:hypothetical protein
MRQDRDQFRPKPRTAGFNPNTRPFSDRPRRSAPPPRPRGPKGPAILAPKEPASGKQHRRMLRAAAWRLARIIHARPAALLGMEIPALQELFEQKCPKKVRHLGWQHGPAMRLLEKIDRLRK